MSFKSKIIFLLEILITLSLIIFILINYVFTPENNLRSFSEPQAKNISLTFDIYQTNNIAYLIDILEQENIKATFFFTAEWLNKFNPEEQPYFQKLQQLVQTKQIEIGNLSDQYLPLNNLDETIVSQRIDQGRATIKKIFNTEPHYFRPPQGKIDQTVIEIAKIYNEKLVLWDIDSLDNSSNRSELELLQRLAESVIPDKVVIFHDNSLTLKLLPFAIDELRKNNFNFFTLSELEQTVYAGISDFNNDYIGHWSAYASKPGILNAKMFPRLGYLRVDYFADPPEWGGIFEPIDTLKRDWSGKEKIEIDMFGYNSQKKFRLIIVDDGNERWFVDFEDSWKGWRTFKIPFSHFAKFTPYTEPQIEDNILGLNYIQEIHISPHQGISSLLIRKIEVK
jgi:peptidoglycan/xylan/chitin deacetylase (PgdA/CDA1 family)